MPTYNDDMTLTTCPSIVATPGTCGGKPRIDGTRIKVKHIFVWVEQMGMTPAEVVHAYPHLSMAAVHAALAYYWSHQEEIQREIEDEERFVADMKAKSLTPRPTLREKLAKFHQGAEEAMPLT